MMLGYSGRFSLAEAASFGFGPTQDDPGEAVPRMTLAFCADDLRSCAGVVLEQAPDGTLSADVTGDADPDAALRQAARILSLDHDGDAWERVWRADPVLAAVVAQRPGMRPVLFHSPYEAAAWAILSARRPAGQAARTRAAIAAEHGVAVADRHAFPTPDRLRDVRPGPGLPQTKVDRLHALAEFALAGELDQPALLAMDPAAAREHVQALDGIGPFYATLIVVRGTGHADVVADEEPVTQGSVAHLYGLGSERATPEQVRDRAEGWHPFRTWASVHLHAAARRAGLGPARYRRRDTGVR